MEENDFVTRHVAEYPLATSRVWLGLRTISQGTESAGKRTEFETTVPVLHLHQIVALNKRTLSCQIKQHFTVKFTDKAAVWMDGSELDFSNWGHFQPHPGCAVLVSTNGTWSTTSCTGSSSRVVCKAPASESPTLILHFNCGMFT